MKLGTRTRYGTRAMLYLARHYGRGPISVTEMAADQQLSPKYLEQVLSSLRGAGLLRSVRGMQGGHLLSRPPDQITAGDIYEALEGRDKFVDCTADPAACERSNLCVTQELWSDLYDACLDVLQGVTLADLAQRAAEKERVAQPDAM